MSEEMQLALEHTLKTMRKLKEAADTITTLRAEVERQVQWVKDLADNLIAEEAKTATLRAEIERLRADLEAADIAVSRLNGRAELQMLMRENNKLRACLVDIATGQVVKLPFIQALARAALSPTASPEME